MPHVMPPERRARGARSWSSAAGSAAWRRPGSRGCAATRSCCSRPPTGWAARSISPPRRPGREEIAGIAGWLAAELEILGVEVRLNTYAETDEVAGPGPGRGHRRHRRPAEHELPGKPARIWSPASGTCWAAMSSSAASVLLYDDHGWHQGPSTAGALAKKGVQVEMVTPDRMSAFEVGATNFPNYLGDALPARRSSSPRTWSCARSAATATGSSPRFWNEYAEARRRARRRPCRGRARHAAGRRALPRAQGWLAQRRRGRRRGPGTGRSRPRSPPTPRAATCSTGSATPCRSRNIHAAIYDALRLCKGL